MARRSTPLTAAAVLALAGVATLAGAAPSAQAQQLPVGHLAASALGSPDVTAGASSAGGAFTPVAPQVLLGQDSSAPLVFGQGARVPVLGVGAIPASGVSAVVVDATLTAATAPASVSVRSADNAAASQAPVPVPASGSRSVELVIPMGSASDLLVTSTALGATTRAQVVGYFVADDSGLTSGLAPGGYQPIDATPVFDTTTAAAPLSPGVDQRLELHLGGVDPHVRAVVLQVSVPQPTAAGSVSVRSLQDAASVASAVSFGPGETMTSSVTVRVSPDGTGALSVVLRADGSAPVPVQVSVVGFYDDGSLGPNLRFAPLGARETLPLAPAAATTPGAVGNTVTAAGAGPNTIALVGTASIAGQPPGSSVFVSSSSDPSDARLAVQAGTGGATTSGSVVVLARDNTFSVVGPAASATLTVTGTLESYPAVANPALKGWVDALVPWQVTATQG